ncbi:hypothetical protein [Sedimentitalea sp.]|uniref:hypothetical protein n=1 Tax=Sedimentitalea sp. TaxID=2048915 RepID=UPI0032981F5B
MDKELMDQDARHIAQDFLDRQGAVTISGDVDATLDWCDIPCTLESAGQRVIVTEQAEMRSICSTFIDRLRSRRLTHMVRRCLVASYQDADTISATYETRYVRDGHLLTEDPYAGFVVLKRRETGWKISNMQFDVSSDSPANVTLRDRHSD